MKPGSKIRVILYKLKKSFVLDILPTQKKTKRKRKLHIYTVYIYIYMIFPPSLWNFQTFTSILKITLMFTPCTMFSQSVPNR